MKRLTDILLSSFGLLVSLPIMVPVCIAIWWQDFYSPFYVAPRMGRNEKKFKMIKLRSMIKNADKSGVDSTSNADNRITRVGQFVRSYKLDEIPQLWNVLKGEMSLVGPRPNVERETNLYTAVEKKLLTVRPGITDFSSIVFADEGTILKESVDPDLDYNQLIRPWKSRLGIFYVENNSFWTDLHLIWLTVLAIVSRSSALKEVQKLLQELGAPDSLVEVAGRNIQLKPSPPPGAVDIVRNREAFQ